MRQATGKIKHVGIAIAQTHRTRGRKRHGLHHIGDRAVKVDIKAAAVGHLVDINIVGKHDLAARRFEEDRADTI